MANNTGSNYSLNDLGIVRDKSPSGEAQLSINLGTHPLLGAADVRAIFNPVSKQWRLSTINRVNGAWPSISSPQHELSRQSEDPGSVPWSDALPKSEYTTRLLNHDWSKSPLGPLENWPCNLRTLFKLMLTDQGASIIYWGKELATVCNSEGSRLLSNRLVKRDESLGRPFAELWPEVWQEFAPFLQRIADTGIADDILRINLFPQSHDSVEETFWSGSFFPIYDDAGHLQGYYNRAREVTKQVISERRTKILSEIAVIRHVSGYAVFKEVVSALEQDPQDFPMAFVYAAREENGRVKLELKASLGLPEGVAHPLVPDAMDLNQSHLGFSPFFRKAKDLGTPVILSRSDPDVAENLFQDFEWRGFEEPADRIAIVPIQANGIFGGLLVHGLNPRVPFDTIYEAFVNSLMGQVSATVSLALDKQESLERAEKLSKQIEDSERQIREMARLGPVGLCRVDLDGKITWANDAYYKITSLTDRAEDQYDFAFLSAYLEEDVPRITDAWGVVAEAQERAELSVRLKRKWSPPANPDGSQPKDEHVWVLASGSPMIDPETKQLISVAGAVTEISKQKWAEGVHERNAAAAKEAKQLQENFIDLVSHEMRNPLSAITQLADTILCGTEDFECTDKTIDDALKVISQNVEGAKTILECAAHQKRIIDDVLTLSKLDSNMFSVTPVAIDPFLVIDYVLRMFKTEADASGVKIKTVKDESYDEYKVKYVALDPSRLTQIFLNLITNAIKFTKLERQRNITVSVGATPTRPPSLNGVEWFKSARPSTDPTERSEWSNNERVYIWFQITDTGRGLEENEMLNLFNRFQQATAKTHIKYGGSGLGLFISRELCETQGGEIGCRSGRGKGTTFAFYIAGRHASAPEENLHTIFPIRPISETRPNIRPTSKQADLHVGSSDINRIPMILIVEDNLVNAKVLKKQLQRAKCQVHVAYHGQEALDCLSKSRNWKAGESASSEGPDFDVILMDIEMPVMDGLTCIRRIRELEKEGTITKHMSIVATTANARKEQLDDVLEAGADDVLPKPFRVQDCLERAYKLMKNV